MEIEKYEVIDPSLFTAFKSSSIPCNPLPFLKGLTIGTRQDGTNWIKTDEAKAILWVLLNQAYGQVETISLKDEFNRLYEVFRENDETIISKEIKAWNDEWKDKIIASKNVHSYQDKPEMGKIIFDTFGFGLIDFYPKANKVLVRKDNKWYKPGLNWLINNLLK